MDKAKVGTFCRTTHSRLVCFFQAISGHISSRQKRQSPIYYPTWPSVVSRDSQLITSLFFSDLTICHWSSTSSWYIRFADVHHLLQCLGSPFNSILGHRRSYHWAWIGFSWRRRIAWRLFHPWQPQKTWSLQDGEDWPQRQCFRVCILIPNTQ